jgi:hypothetical protein
MGRVVGLWAIAVLAVLSCSATTTKTFSSKQTRRSRQTKFCNKVDGCPAIDALQAENKALAAAVALQEQINNNQSMES